MIILFIIIIIPLNFAMHFANKQNCIHSEKYMDKCIRILMLTLNSNNGNGYGEGTQRVVQKMKKF